MHEPNADRVANATERALANVIRGTAMGLLIGGGICLFFGFSLLIDAPGSASEEATAAWFAVDRVFQWALRVLGVVFLLAAGLAAMGSRVSQALALVAEGGFALFALALAAEATLEARADGHWDIFAILYLVLAAMGMSAAKRSWDLFVLTAQPSPWSPEAESK